MTQGFYELLGVDAQASTEELRASYARLVARIERRRTALVDQGGDTSTLDLARMQADEAWEVVSHSRRRRRYDAMVALTRSGLPPCGTEAELEQLWGQVAGAMVDPVAGAAAEIVRVCTNLAVGGLPPVPRVGPPPRVTPATVERSVGPTAVPSETNVPTETDFEDTVPGVDSLSDLVDGGSDSGSVVSFLTGRPAEVTSEPQLRVVEGSASGPPVIVLQSRDQPTVSSEDVARLIDQHGYSGALLRAVRKARGLSVQDVADTTRISVKYLEAVEGDERHKLPSATFVRGYVREMARLLKLDVDTVVSEYMTRFTAS